ncbi:hypothetical protein MLD38_017801 [Melastoma candidum]|uniref:Uncharacterized protein n=1 Tax=Melastoma candidum TaxID=119954 RepID=A0ACB9QRV4_9MYRT|nr:hypothetical protein MLD38_017801 [Melastoma candidum]
MAVIASVAAAGSSPSLSRVPCLPLPPSYPHGVRRRVARGRWLNFRMSPRLDSRRFDSLNSRCSITNTDAPCGQVAVDDDVPREDLAVGTNEAIPVIHLKPEILESELESSSLLSEDTYADSLLTALPVLTEEEQNALAATPAHPAGLYALYASSLTGSLVEQLWNFTWPSAIAMLHPSLLPVAVMGFFAKLTIIAGGPLVGKLMDLFPRVPAYNVLNVIQATAQLVSAAVIIHAYSVTVSPSSMLQRPWFICLVLAGAIERLAGIALGVAFERDWVVLLAGVNRPIALAQANAVLNRIDLLCEIFGASLFGILLSKYDPVTCLKYAAGMMVFSLPVTVLLTWLTNKLSSGVLDRPKVSQYCGRKCYDALPESDRIVNISLQAIRLGWKEYIQQPVLPASLAYVLLYFNVVLAPGSLMTAFLTQRGLNPSVVGGFSGLCSFMGVAATFVSAKLVERLGILKAGATGLVLQASLLTLAVAVYWSGTLSHCHPLLFFLSLIVLSRLGHMSYDLIGSQILQTGIPSSKANLIATTEVAVASLAESVMLGVAILANDASHFRYLAALSLLSVVGAAWMFCRWLLNPTDEQRSLFAFDAKF